MLHYIDHQRDGTVVEVQFQRAEYVAANLLYLLFDQVVFYSYLNGGELVDVRCDVFHARSDTDQPLGHAVAHGHPLVLQLMLVEDLIFMVAVSFLLLVVASLLLAFVEDVAPGVGNGGGLDVEALGLGGWRVLGRAERQSRAED